MVLALDEEFFVVLEMRSSNDCLRFFFGKGVSILGLCFQIEFPFLFFSEQPFFEILLFESVYFVRDLFAYFLLGV